MNFYYNLTLNFNALKFYEWSFEDNLIEIKKIPIIRVKENVLVNLCKYNGDINIECLKTIKNKTAYKEDGKIKTIMYAALFTDTKFCVAIIFDMNGCIKKRSFLLLEDELNIIEIGYSIKKEKIEFSKKEMINYNQYYKQEEEMKVAILKEIENAYSNKDNSRLMYYYLEWFKKNCTNINTIYNKIKERVNSSDDLESMYNLITSLTN